MKDILTAREAERAADAAARGIQDPDPSPGGVSVVETPDSVESVESSSGSNAEGSPADTMQTVPMAEQAWPPKSWLPKSNLLRWTRTKRTGSQEHGMLETAVQIWQVNKSSIACHTLNVRILLEIAKTMHLCRHAVLRIGFTLINHVVSTSLLVSTGHGVLVFAKSL